MAADAFHEILVDRGEDILKTIEREFLRHGWKEAVVTNAIGSVKDLELSTPLYDELPLRVVKTPWRGASEILSFTGEIMPKEKMDPELKAVYPDKGSPLFIHIHASSARAGGSVMGGGLRGGTAFRRLRVFLRVLE